MTMPILPGFHPDPSICRVGDAYYVATSTFEYVPGVPIHRSTDLLAWEHVGHALTDAAVVNAAPGQEGASQGIFAPTLRHHDGRFWMTTTSIRDLGRGQLIVHASAPEGPWSAPVYVPDTPGIDPDLAWDDDGRCLLTWRGFAPPGIHQIEIDPATGERRGEERVLWEGTGLADTEGPHVIRRGDWWYLLVAEGGTHLGHGVSIARSRDPRGPFEAHPANPIHSHRSTDHPVQAVGHPDLVELADGSWAMVHLGIRQSGSFPRYHVNGRETFLVGVDWVDGWPVVVEERFEVPGVDRSWRDAFDAGVLHPRWVAPSESPDSFARAGDGGVGTSGSGLWLGSWRERDSSEQRHVLCARAVDRSWEADAEVLEGDACLSVRIDASHWVGVEVVDGAAGERVARLRAVSAPFDQILATLPVLPGDRIGLSVEVADGAFANGVGPDAIAGFVLRDGARLPMGAVDGRYVSTEVAGGFTGRMIGLEAIGGPARVGSAAYRSVTP